MSAPAFAWAFEKGHELGLTSSQLLLLLYMADQANGQGWFFTGLPRMAKYSRLCVRTIRDLIPELTKLELIRAEHRPGKSTVYYVLRQPQGEATTAAPATAARQANGATPATTAWVTPATTAVANGTHPGNPASAPRQPVPLTPAATAHDPSSTQEETLKKRARETARNDAAAAAAPDGRSGDDAAPLVPPKAPSLGTTTAGGPANALRPPGATSDDFRDWLDRGAPACLTTAAPDTLTEDDTPRTEADRAHMAAQLADLAASLAGNYQNNYPPRAASMSADDQITTLVERPRARAFHLATDQLAAARAQLRARVPA